MLTYVTATYQCLDKAVYISLSPQRERERDENWRQVFAPNASPVIKSTDLVSQNN